MPAPVQKKNLFPKLCMKMRVRLTDGSRRYVDPAYSGNKKLRPQHAIVNGEVQCHPEGVYAVRRVRDGVRVWETLGSDAQLAETKLMRLHHSAQALSLGLEPPATEREPSDTSDDLDDVIAIYLRDTEAMKSKKTFQAYSLALRGFRHACTRPTKPYEVSRRDILTFISYLKKQGHVPRTVSNRINFFKTFLSQCKVPWPMEKSDKVKYTPKKVKIYSKRELATLMAVATRDEKDLISFFLYTGAREQEAQFATWGDIDFDSMSFTVREKLDLGFTPKDREEDDVPLPDHFIQMLRERMCRYPEARLIFPTPDVFTDGHLLRIVKSLALEQS